MTSADTVRLPSITAKNSGSVLTTTTATAATTLAARRDIDSSLTKPKTGGAVVACAGGAGGGGGGGVGGVPPGKDGDRRTLPGVGTYLIDTPKDSRQSLRQRFLSFQEQHRGVAKWQNETLPEIPFRLNPRSEPPSQTSTSTMNRSLSTLKADVATSPMPQLDGDSNLSPTRTASPAPSMPRTVTFATDLEMTSGKVKHMKTKRVSRGGKGSIITERTDAAPSLTRSASFTEQPGKNGTLTKSASFTEQPRKPNPKKCVRECSKLNFFSFNSADFGKEPSHSHVTGWFPDLPDSSRTNQTLNSSRKKSSSLSDLTDMFSLHKNDGDTKTPRSLDISSDNFGPTSFFQMSKSKSLLGLKKEHDEKLLGMSAYHKRQRVAQLAFRRDKSLRRADTLSFEEADKQWMDLVTTQVVDNTEYDKFASRKKPTIPKSKKQGKSYTPRSGVNFKISHPASGKVYPVFFNDGLPVRKFGHAVYRRKLPKSKT